MPDLSEEEQGLIRKWINCGMDVFVLLAAITVGIHGSPTYNAAYGKIDNFTLATAAATFVLLRQTKSNGEVWVIVRHTDNITKKVFQTQKRQINDSDDMFMCLKFLLTSHMWEFPTKFASVGCKMLNSQLETAWKVMKNCNVVFESSSDDEVQAVAVPLPDTASSGDKDVSSYDTEESDHESEETTQVASVNSRQKAGNKKDKPKKPRTRKHKADGKKKPWNAYTVFISEKSKEIGQHHEISSARERMQILAAKYKNLTAEEKGKYKAKADEWNARAEANAMALVPVSRNNSVQSVQKVKPTKLLTCGVQRQKSAGGVKRPYIKKFVWCVDERNEFNELHIAMPENYADITLMCILPVTVCFYKVFIDMVHEQKILFTDFLKLGHAIKKDMKEYPGCQDAEHLWTVVNTVADVKGDKAMSKTARDLIKKQPSRDQLWTLLDDTDENWKEDVTIENIPVPFFDSEDEDEVLADIASSEGEFGSDDETQPARKKQRTGRKKQ